MVQFCCGTGDCTSAGVERRDDLETSSMSSQVFRDAAGDLIVPHAVGDATGDKFDIFLEDHGLNASSMVKSRSVSGTPVYKIGTLLKLLSKSAPATPLCRMATHTPKQVSEY